jgi:2-deoxy-D-gluconate 3-dehydrogenase
MAGTEQFGLAGHTALITGATGGLGAAMCRAFAAAGANVALAEHPDRVDAAHEMARSLSELGVSTTAVAMDVTDLDSIERGVAHVDVALGGADILVANAGVNVPRPALEVTEEDWDRVLDVDLKGVFFTCQAAGKRMVRRGSGAIVAIASQNGLIGYPQRAAYCAAKAGVVNLVRVLALEWASHGVRVNAVGPTFVETPLTKITLAQPEIRDDILRRIPLGRLGTPEEVANAVLFLASPAASLITGTTLLADGGWTAI